MIGYAMLCIGGTILGFCVGFGVCALISFLIGR